MRRPAMLAGIGGIAFGVLTIVGLALMNPPGGNYKASSVSDYLEKGHRVSVIGGLYLEVLALVGLLILLAYLRDLLVSDWTRRLFWAFGIIAVGGLAMGWAIMAAGAVARLFGGRGVVVSAPTSYLVSEIGGTIVWGPAAILLACALITLTWSSTVALPSWLRWLTLVFGIIGLASLAFFTSLALVIWGVVIGVWLLVSGGRTEPAPAA